MIKNKGIEREYAVSPVVNVMLMLVVTIIIAAVVSAFAGGLTTEKERAPQATLETHITLGDSMMTGTAGPILTIKHMGGDPINTRNIKLITSWADNTGIYHMQSTVAPVWGTEAQTYTTAHSPGTSNYTMSSLNTRYTFWGDTLSYNAPYLVVAGKTPTGTGYADNDTALWFGNYIFRAGDIMKADTDNTVSGTADGQNQATPIIKDGDLLTGNEIVSVQMIDLKSGSPIYDKNVVLEV